MLICKSRPVSYICSVSRARASLSEEGREYVQGHGSGGRVPGHLRASAKNYIRRVKFLPRMTRERMCVLRPRGNAERKIFGMAEVRARAGCVLLGRRFMVVLARGE